MATRSRRSGTPTEALLAALGGREASRRGRLRLEELREKVRRGLPYDALESLLRRFELPRDQTIVVLRLSPRTLARRKAERRLSVEESDRLLRLARVVERAVQVLGDRERARRWLTAPSPALGQAVPLALLDTDLGTHQVEELLGRIDFGVYS